MKTTQPNSRVAQIYNICFVVILMALFWFVMIMSARQDEFTSFEESFFPKNLLIQNFNRLRIRLGDRVFPNVLIGKDGWMEYTGDHNLDDYQNAIAFSPRMLQAMAQTIQSCQQYAREQNMTFLIVVAPNKASIYPDQLPEQIQPLSERSRLDQLISYLEAENIPGVLDLRPALWNARQQQDVYSKMGTHWNEFGAYVAYETIIHSLTKDHPELEPYPAKFFRFRNRPPNEKFIEDRGLANMLRARHLSTGSVLFSTRTLDEIIYKIDIEDRPRAFHRIAGVHDSDLPSLLFFHDSFGNEGLNDFLALNFSKAFYIHRGSVSQYLNRQTIENLAPDIMIYELVERDLDAILRDMPRCAAE
jgi:alginate O-acetyltransferase complex protein AlgJ